MMQTFWIGLSVLALLAAAAVIVYDRRKTKKTLRTIDAMLDDALNGAYAESAWDESTLSAVEAKLARALRSSDLSARSLRQQKAKLEELVADISHQTKTPIANILLYAQLLEEQDLPEEAGELIASLTGQSEKLRTLIEALVKTSRLETGVFQFQPRQARIRPMLEETVRQTLPKAQRKGISLQLDCPDNAEAVLDLRWTAEAVGNLLDNAVKYTQEGGAVAVRVSEYDMFCRVDVADNGPGIAEEEQAKVFQRFYRSAASADAEGVGLGLYLARQIVTGQGGYIRLSSQPGEGATFSVFLPRS